MKTLCFLLALCSSTVAYAFSGQGAGTEKEPYLVSNADELFEVRNNLSAHYQQVDDIDLTQFIQEEMPRLGWLPIGTDSQPFKGVYNGNGKSIKGLYINRDSEDYIGLFGYGTNATISNLSLLNPQIIGGGHVGALIGHSSATIHDIVVMDGLIKGTQYVGSISGYNYSSTSIYKCYSSALIQCQNSSTNACAGICGFNYGVIRCNRFDGEINHKAASCYGITLSSTSANNTSIYGNIMSGKITAKATVYGISNYAKVSMKNNFMVADSLFGSSIYKIAYSSNFPTNYALNNTVLICDGKETQVDDNAQQGISMGPKTLKKQSTYEGAEFDFNTVWRIKEGETYPYLQIQSDPATITTFTYGSKGIISGTADGTGKVYVFINGTLFESVVVDNLWSVSLGSIEKGCQAKVYVATNGKMPSIKEIAIASDTATIESPDVIKGDANGDSQVDASDIVSIVNYLLGKPSSSFNQANADANSDGQILVDDAVETINIITNQQ